MDFLENLKNIKASTRQKTEHREQKVIKNIP